MKIVGPGTRALAAKRPGDRVAVLGPLGRPFGSARRGPGGCPSRGARRRRRRLGAAAASGPRELARRRASASISSTAGAARSTSHAATTFAALAEQSGGELSRPPRTASPGRRGLRHRTARRAPRRGPLSQDLLPAVRWACSTRLAESRAEHGVPGEAALETPMGCGFGACLGCAVELVDGRFALCCKDGPVFALRRGELVSGAVRRSESGSGRPDLTVRSAGCRCRIRFSPPAAPSATVSSSPISRRSSGSAASSPRGSRSSRSAATRRRASARPRGGMLNSIGLQNIGIEKFLADVLPGLGRFPAQVVVNLFGYEFDDYARLAERVDAFAGVAAVELNVSCPNVTKGGIEFGHDPELLERLVRSVRAVDRQADRGEALAERDLAGRRSARRRRRAAPTSSRRSTPCSAWRSIRWTRRPRLAHYARRTLRSGDQADRGAHRLRRGAGRSACR